MVFYPKWTTNDTNYETKIYYNLVTENGGYIKGLTWNLDNYTFDEYETGAVNLNAGTKYYIVDASDSTIKYGPYTVDKTSTYKMYFSVENSWNGSNVYIESVVKTYYFSVKNWTDTIYAYLWNETTNAELSKWPGTIMTYVETNSYGEKIFKIDVDLSLYDHIIFTHGSNGVASGSKTIDIDLTSISSNGFYLKEKNSDGYYEYGTYSR